MRSRQLLLTFAAVMAPTLARAHVGAGTGGGTLDAFVHPFLGLDHVMVMTVVGVHAALLGGRMLFALPAAFVGSVLAGLLASAGGVGLPYVELGIVLSIMALGVLLAAHRLVPVAVVLAATIAAGLFHGHAHGTELVGDSGAYLVVLGVAAGTAILHGIGITAMLATAGRLRDRVAVSYGVVAAAIGGLLLAG